MPALSIAAAPLAAANDIEADVTAAELDWLESALRTAEAPGLLSAADADHDLAWVRLERLSIALGMPEDAGDSAAAWAADYLARHGRHVPINMATVIGAPEYRQRHIAMLWHANLWHEAIMVLSGAGAIGLLFYAIAKGAQSWM